MFWEILKKIGRFVGGAFLVVAGVGLGVRIFLILADVLTFVLVSWHFYNAIEVYGTINEFVNKMIAVVLAGLIVLLMNKIALYIIIKRDNRWVAIVMVVGIIIAVNTVMYFVTWPYHNATTDIRTGETTKQCYRDQNGQLQTLGLGAKAGPYGQTVRPCTIEEQDEIERQTGGEAMALHVDVEQVEVLPDKTILHFAVKRINNFRLGRFYQPHGWNYLSDETGQTYDLAKDNATYPDPVDADSHKDFDYSDKPHAATHIVRPDETYRFTDEYAPLKPGINHLRLHDSRFGEADLDYMLAQGQVAQVRAQAEAQQEAEARAQADAEAKNQQEAEALARARAEAEAQQEADARTEAQDRISRRAQEDIEAHDQAAERTRAQQAQAQQVPVPCPPDPPPLEPGHMYLPSVAFRVIPAGCVPVAPQQSQSSTTAPERMVILVAVTPYPQRIPIAINALRANGYGAVNFFVNQTSNNLTRLWIGPFSNRQEVDFWRNKLISDEVNPNPIVQPE